VDAGHGILAVARGATGSVVTRAVARSPLQLLVPRNHGHAVWAFLSSHGGGLVDGDEVVFEVEVDAGAAALLTTQASTKVYRSPRGCRQRVSATVGDGGLLVVVPDPVVCFAGARLEQSIAIDLGDGASVVLVDSTTAGRVAHGERWAFARYRSVLSVSRTSHGGNRVLVHDAIELDPRHGPLAARLGRFDALATVIAVGPKAALREVPRADDFVAATSPIPDGNLVRVAAASVEALHCGLRIILGEIAPLLGDDPFARKW
jgi:urease accessory protein